jgi:hypothetical protein
VCGCRAFDSECDRHLVAHETENVTKVYKYTLSRIASDGSRREFSNFRPAEHTYWNKGKYRAGNFTKICRVVVDKIAYSGGSSWKCAECGEEFALAANYRGTDIDHFARNIEKHLRGKKLHGSCDTAREKLAKRRKRAAREKKKGKGKRGKRSSFSGLGGGGYRPRNRWNQVN